MTKTEFREKHSELIEYYQYIEMHLKGICATLLADEERGWFDRLSDYELDPLGKLIKELCTFQTQKQMGLLSQEDFESLEKLRETRNYWVHQCFSDNTTHVIFKNGNVRNPGHAQGLSCALNDAIAWDERLAEVARSLNT